MKDHLILFDDTCALCRRVIARVIARDVKRKFFFSSLESRAAKQALKGTMAYIRKQNTIVMIENIQKQPCIVWTRGRAMMRIYWLLGGKVGRCFGWLCYVPGLTDLVYRLFTRLRKKFPIEDVPERYFRANRDLFLS